MSGRGLFLALPGAALLLLDLLGLYLQRGDDSSGLVAVIAAQGVVYFVAAFWVASRRPARLPLILVFAALLRLPLLASPPYLSDDVYRYVWDGRVQAAGINPYRYVPAAPELAALRDDEIYPRINRRDYAPTIYPPLAQLHFLATTRVSESVAWMKASMVAWEALAIALLVALLRRAGQPDVLVLLYAWHPLPIWEFAGSGHVDAAAIACMLAALLARAQRRTALAGVALGVAVLFKLYPLVLLPALWRRCDWRMPAALASTIVAGYLPYSGAGRGVLGFLPGYLREEGLVSGSRFWLLQLAQGLGLQLHPAVYLVPVAVALAALAGWVSLRRPPRGDIAGGSLLLATAAVLAFSPHYAWYVAWLLPLAAPAASVPVLLLGVLAFLFYFEIPSSRVWIGTSIYVPVILLALFRARTGRAPRDVAREATEGAHEPAA